MFFSVNDSDSRLSLWRRLANKQSIQIGFIGNLKHHIDFEQIWFGLDAVF